MFTDNSGFAPLIARAGQSVTPTWSTDRMTGLGEDGYGPCSSVHDKTALYEAGELFEQEQPCLKCREHAELILISRITGLTTESNLRAAP